MNHATLVARGERFLRRRLKALAVLAEPRGAPNGEHPDVIGWLADGSSIVLEAKTTRKDFKAEASRVERKEFRREPELGMGNQRFYIAPPNVIAESELLGTGWGLIVAYPTTNLIMLDSGHFHRNANAELRLLIRRASDPEVQKQLSLNAVR